MTCNWEVKLFISPGLSEAERIDEYNFMLDEEQNTYVILNYTTNSIDEHHPDRKNNNEYAEETICNKHIAEIEKLLLMRMIHNSLFEPIEIKKEKNPVLVNRNELEKAGVNLRRKIRASFEQRYALLNTNNTFSEAIAFIDKCKTIDTTKEFLLQVAKWLAKAESRTNHVENFTILWTSFNTIFDICSNKPKDSDADKIKGAINSLFNPTIAENLLISQKTNIEKLIAWNLISRNGTNYSQHLKNSFNSKTPDYILVLKMTFLSIYVIRNQVFHDGPRTLIIEEKSQTCAEVLRPFLAEALHLLFTE